ncbi:transporter substrate-binding domain-containing protein [Pelagicoccus albus]|uniref:Transporter substrate-binding domain-containing protein n=1 Tax=Pelagicoccus albus TaxID=415222 RepID=A0A7X1B806_9BACT|nr:transporter substrate-binding domain-containing protein [Pelagicoccus albus]MBC2607089.1 transporter substrate-binding domain-containing protein [Pelagicoccus albus]
MTSRILLSIFLGLATLLAPVSADKETSRLDLILERGYLTVGTTGDFKPFTYLNPKTEEYEGIDIDAAKDIAAKLGVELHIEGTTWPTLVEGILEDRYDLAVGGITRTLSRQTQVYITEPYFQTGKCPLVREADVSKLSTIADLNQPSVRVGVNPGGTNERFVRQMLPQANVTVVEDNLSIPGKVLAGEFDVMITDNVEAMIFEKKLPGLAASHPSEPFTVEDFGYLLPRGDEAWLNWLNLYVHQANQKGYYRDWEEKWLELHSKPAEE